MKIIKTDFRMNVNASSSFKVYICKSFEEAQAVSEVVRSVIPTGGDWYSSVRFHEVGRACFVPSLFHDRGYWVVCVEHNRGNWDAEPVYELYMVD